MTIQPDKYEYKKDGYKPDQEVFVFGSNLDGIHGAGAAHEALRNYGAVWRKGVGLHGQSYAIPTKDENIKTMPIPEIFPYIISFIEFARRNPKVKFYVTKIGCGLAGYKDHQIAPLFRGSPLNCSFAEDWKPYLE